ncbi:cupin domain-containing protein [Paenibacillus herberti]|uniref:cupin domain-containing protein n=1 Tax=Paenibacillus herberti TaxID=1619309 RepID=UPI001FE5005D|nr:AraC family ligand binding domain-containing protein [Paenibacillus herberti]
MILTLFKIKSNQVLGKHRHTGGAVIGYNIQGTWRYEGRNWVATPGTFVFEPPGDIHTLITEDEEVLNLHTDESVGFLARLRTQAVSVLSSG